MLILPKGNDSMGARRMWNRRSVAVVADPLPSTSIQFHAFTPKRAGDLVVASAGCPSTAAAAPPRQTERRFKRSSEFGRSVGRSVVFVVVSLFHVIVLSSPPSSVPFANVRSVDCCSCIFSFIFGSQQSRQKRGEERRGAEIHCVPSSEKCP